MTKPMPKDKITLCLCVDPTSLFFWINTEARYDGDGQMPLSAADHPAALRHDCFLDCHRVTTFPQRELDAAQHRGPISADLAFRIARFLTDTPPDALRERQRLMAIEALMLIANPPVPLQA